MAASHPSGYRAKLWRWSSGSASPAAGIDPTAFSGHSLRAGFAASAVQAGVSTLKIRAQTGHASDAMLAHYVRDGELFVDNAASELL